MAPGRFQAVTRAAVLFAGMAFVSGCNCNETGFSYPEGDDPKVIDPPTSYGSWLSFDTAPDNQRLTMSYYDRDRGALGYAVGAIREDQTVAWMHERVDGYPDSSGLDLANVGKYSSQKTAPDGSVWIAFHDLQAGTLKVAHRVNAEWLDAQVIDGSGTLPGVGHWASLAIDATGNPVVAHCDNLNNAIRVTRFDGTGWATTQVYASRPVEVVDDQGVVTTIPARVGYADIVVDGANEWLAFYDGASGDLHVMQGSNGAFTDAVVDSADDVGAWPSLWVEGEELWVAYQDLTNEDLKVGIRSAAGAWALERVDTAQMRGADTAMFAKDGAPAVVYFDGMDNDAWFATKAGGSWAVERIAGEAGAVGFHNEVIYAGGSWWAGSYDFTANTLAIKAL